MPAIDRSPQTDRQKLRRQKHRAWLRDWAVKRVRLRGKSSPRSSLQTGRWPPLRLQFRLRLKTKLSTIASPTLPAARASCNAWAGDVCDPATPKPARHASLAATPAAAPTIASQDAAAPASACVPLWDTSPTALTPVKPSMCSLCSRPEEKSKELPDLSEVASTRNRQRNHNCCPLLSVISPEIALLYSCVRVCVVWLDCWGLRGGGSASSQCARARRTPGNPTPKVAKYREGAAESCVGAPCRLALNRPNQWSPLPTSSIRFGLVRA